MSQSTKEILSKVDKTTLDNTHFFQVNNKCYSFLNPYGYNLMRKNKETFEKLDGIFFDGVLLCVFYNFFYRKRIKRKSFDMTSIAKSLFEFLSENNNYNIYFIGAKEEEIIKAVHVFRKDYPQMNIRGFRNGYFNNENERLFVIKDILNINPDFVIVGMGAIVQEKFVIDLKESGYKGISFTCGGFFHQAAESLFFFPKWVNRLHLRSFYRLYKEKATRKRFSKTIIDFPFNFLKDKFFL